ncbi:MAG: DUF3800 domain-containing protein [Actinomycetota bacterium]|nr:DUF3800 domain-containing protein [Actinomycetota bacterium]
MRRWKKQAEVSPAAASLTLADHEAIPTAICFFDESGVLGRKATDPRDKYFGVGMIKCREPYYLTETLRVLRDRRSYYKEMKWTLADNRNLRIYKMVVDEYFKTAGPVNGLFSALIVEAAKVDLRRYYGGSTWKAYEWFAAQLLKATMNPAEVLTVLADELSTPPDVQFEVDLKSKINNEFGRLAIADVARIRSSGSDIMQMTDILLGGVMYNFLLADGALPNPGRAKKTLHDHICSHVHVKSFDKGCKQKGFAVFHFRPGEKIS